MASGSHRNDKGQGLVEYGLILALVAVLCLASTGNAGDRVRGLLELCHTAASGGSPTDGCTGMVCGGGASCALTCRCTPNRPHCHATSCN